MQLWPRNNLAPLSILYLVEYVCSIASNAGLLTFTAPTSCGVQNKVRDCIYSPEFYFDVVEESANWTTIRFVHKCATEASSLYPVCVYTSIDVNLYVFCDLGYKTWKTGALILNVCDTCVVTFAEVANIPGLHQALCPGHRVRPHRLSHTSKNMKSRHSSNVNETSANLADPTWDIVLSFLPRITQPAPLCSQ